HAMSLRVPQTEVPVGFKDRPEGSESKLRTYRDGFRILSLIVELVRHERPLMFYGIIGLLLALVGLALGTSVVIEFVDTGFVPRLPTAVLALGTVIVAVLSLLIGLVLDGVLKARRELSRLNYLTYQAPPIG
ncbi:MAG: glycosyl transferase, partial [Microbacterium sp.]